jgi:hypothetical protein
VQISGISKRNPFKLKANLMRDKATNFCENKDIAFWKKLQPFHMQNFGFGGTPGR